MCLLVLSEQGITVKRESRRVYAEKDDQELFEIQTRKISAVAVMGNAQITTQALALFANEGIPVTYLTIEGGIKGQFLPVANQNMSLRFSQYKAAIDDLVSLQIAKMFVVKKLKSIISFYQSLQKHQQIDDCRQIIKTINEMIKDAEDTNDYDTLLGIEGMGSRIHFNRFGNYFKGELTFSRRSHYPPEDEANALMSLTYTMLAKLINGLLHASGLDIYTGFLHKPKYNRASLTCDFQELYRVNTADRFVLTLVNKGQIKKKHFIDTDRGPRLTPEGSEIFFSAWKNIAYNKDGSELVRDLQKEIVTIIKVIKLIDSEECTEEPCTSSLTT